VSVYAKLKKIIDIACEIENIQQNDLDKSIDSLAKNLAVATGKDVGRLGINIYDEGHVFYYCLELIGDECRVTKQREEDLRFEINVTKETWAKIAMGELAPMDAFLMGQMALSGDPVFGRRLYAKLAATGGRKNF
jgi:putative sterol carrier protein